jgi:hypothetical protein
MDDSQKATLRALTEEAKRYPHTQEDGLKARGYAQRWVADPRNRLHVQQEGNVLIKKFAATALHMGAPVQEIVRVAAIMTQRTRTRIRQVIYGSTECLRRE